MKTSIPKLDEIKQLIAAAESLRALEQENAAASGQLKTIQEDLRRAVADVMLLPPRPGESLFDALELYHSYVQQGARQRSSTVSELAEQEAARRKAFEERSGAIEAERKQLRGRVNGVCAVVQTGKHAEYSALLAEIAGKLTPYCEGDTAIASELSKQTPCAITLFTLIRSADPVIYGRDDLISPLKAAVRILTLNPIKS